MSEDQHPVEDYAAWLVRRRRIQGIITPVTFSNDIAELRASELIRELMRGAMIGGERIELGEGAPAGARFVVFERRLDERVSDLEKRSENLETRVYQIEQNSKRTFLEDNWFEIVGEIIRLFSSVDSLIQVYCKKNELGIDLLFVHNSKNRIGKQEEILMKTLDLEEKYAMLSFDYLILHVEEAAQADLASKILIFDKSQPI